MLTNLFRMFGFCSSDSGKPIPAPTLLPILAEFDLLCRSLFNPWHSKIKLSKTHNVIEE